MDEKTFVSKKTFDSYVLTDPKYGIEYHPPPQKDPLINIMNMDYNYRVSWYQPKY